MTSGIHMTLQAASKNNRGAVTVSALLASMLIFVVALSGAELSKNALQQRANLIATADVPPLYLPEAKYVKLVTLGFNNFVGDILWFNTINYFGQQYLENKDYRWLAQMCDIVTTLDPVAIHQYEFCGTLLSWVAKQPAASNELLRKAIARHPNYWRFRYQRGFNYWYFLEDRQRATEELTAASQIPGAPPFVASLASRLMVDTQDPEMAISFLKEMIGNADDKLVREALEDKLKRAYLSRDLQRISDLVKRYESERGEAVSDLEQLVEAGMLRFVPQDPFGGKYYLDTESGTIKTSSNERGLEFTGKTAKTGAMQHEYK